MKAITEEQRIAARYKQFGISSAVVQQIVQDGMARGFSRKAALTGARLALSREFGIQEYFTPEDIAEALDTTVDEVNRLIEENKDELIKNGGIAKVTFSADFTQ